MPLFASKVFPAVLLMLTVGTAARADVDIDAKAKQVAKNIVIVDVTLRNENSSREDSGQGLVVSKDGIVLISGNLIPDSIPKEWVADIKIRVPDKDFAPTPAKFLGRTRDRLFAYLKPDAPIAVEPFQPGDTGESKLGQEVFGVGMMSKSGGYEIYVGKSDVRTSILLTHQIISTASFGLTRSTSPVYDAKSGLFLGLTTSSFGDAMTIRDAGVARRIELSDEDQSSTYLPISEVADLFKNIPEAPFDLPRPWLAVDDMTGMEEGLRAVRHVEEPAGVTIGSVIPNEAADKAGLKARDLVLRIDGKEFSTSPVPDLMILHFQRAIEQHQPGDKITLGILRDGKTMSIPVTLGTTPKTAAEMTHIFSDKIGITTRDLVFADAYSRRLPQDTKGVMVALVKSGSPAALGTTPLQNGYWITKVDDQPVTDQKSFLEVLKKEQEKPDLKEMVFAVIQRTGETQVCRIDLTK